MSQGRKSGRAKFVPPAVTETAFNCPHCGAYAKQNWQALHAIGLHAPHGTPMIGTPDMPPAPRVRQPGMPKLGGGPSLHERLAAGQPFVTSGVHQTEAFVQNVFLSICTHCQEVAVWVHTNMVWPNHGEAPEPNPDLSDDIRRDYLEASSIVTLSPRGAAALLRLAIQKLCVELGGKGERINDDIAALVEKGLDELVQKALDAVRVIGNGAVHPGLLDLKDDKETTMTLFSLINIIAEIMVSRPKQVNAIYNSLPAAQRAAIQKRDEKP